MRLTIITPKLERFVKSMKYIHKKYLINFKKRSSLGVEHKNFKFYKRHRKRIDAYARFLKVRESQQAVNRLFLFHQHHHLKHLQMLKM